MSHERLVFLVRQCVRLRSSQLTISCGFYIFVYLFIFNYALLGKQSSGSYEAFKDSHVTASAIGFVWL